MGELPSDVDNVQFSNQRGHCKDCSQYHPTLADRFQGRGVGDCWAINEKVSENDECAAVKGMFIEWHFEPRDIIELIVPRPSGYED